MWPVEISKDVLKNDKKLVTTKRGASDQFLTIETREWMGPNFFLIDFDIQNVEIRVRMRKL